MTDDITSPERARWVVSGFWLWNHRATLVGLPLVGVVAVVVFGIRYASADPPPWWLPALFAAVIGFLIWVQVRTATEADLEADGTLVLRRSWLADVRVPAATVRTIGRPVLTGSRAGVRVRSARITVPLAVGFPDVAGLADALVAHNPELRIGTL